MCHLGLLARSFRVPYWLLDVFGFGSNNWTMFIPGGGGGGVGSLGGGGGGSGGAGSGQREVGKEDRGDEMRIGGDKMRIGGDEMRVPCRKEREEHTRNQICSGHRVETRICVCWGRCQCHQRFSYLAAVGPGWAGTPGAAHSGEFDSLRSRSCSARRSPCRRHCPSGILQWPELGIAVQRCF